MAHGFRTALLAAAIALGSGSTASAASADGPVLVFPREAQVYAQVGPDERGRYDSVPFLALQKFEDAKVDGTLNAYLVARGTRNCARGGRCPDARATPSVRTPEDLPERFEITLPRKGASPPTVPSGAVEGAIVADYDGSDLGLRPGARARVGCVEGLSLCWAIATYAPGFSASFFCGPDRAACLRGTVAVDGFMRDVIEDKPAYPPSAGLARVGP